MNSPSDDQFTDSELADAVKAGNPLAALELFTRYDSHVSRLAARHGQHIAFDRDDVRQECFIQVVLAALRSVDTGETFQKSFLSPASNAIAREAAKYRHPVPIPLRDFHYVYDAVKRLGSPTAARHYLAHEATGWERVSTETFDAIWLLAFGVHLEWSSSTEHGGTVQDRVEDISTADAFASIEDQDHVRYLLDLVEHGLGSQAREVLARTYGLDGHPAALWDNKKDAFIAATSEIVAAEMGVHPVTVRRIRSRAIAYLQIHAEEY